MKKINKPGFAFGETLSISTLGPSSGLPERFVMSHINATEINTTSACSYFLSEYRFCLPLFPRLTVSLMLRSWDSFWPCSDHQEEPEADTHGEITHPTLMGRYPRSTYVDNSEHTPVPVNADWRNPPACRLAMSEREEPDCRATAVRRRAVKLIHIDIIHTNCDANCMWRNIRVTSVPWRLVACVAKVFIFSLYSWAARLLYLALAVLVVQPCWLKNAICQRKVRTDTETQTGRVQLNGASPQMLIACWYSAFRYWPHSRFLRLA